MSFCLLPLQQVLEKLPAELKAQQKNFAAVASRLKAQSATWLRNTPGLRNLSDTFVLHWCGHAEHAPASHGCAAFDKWRSVICLPSCSRLWHF